MCQEIINDLVKIVRNINEHEPTILQRISGKGNAPQEVKTKTSEVTSTAPGEVKSKPQVKKEAIQQQGKQNLLKVLLIGPDKSGKTSIL